MAEWSACRTRSLAAPGLSSALAIARFVLGHLGRPEFKSSATRVNIQLVASYQLAFSIQ